MNEKLTFEKLYITKLESQQKFEYYFLGVIIALLSFSVQVYNPENNYNFQILVFIVWGFLLISLLSGFYRLERIQMILHYDTDRMYFIQYKNQNSESKIIKEFYKKSKEVSNKALTAYKIEKWSFIFAIIIYLVFKIINT